MNRTQKHEYPLILIHTYTCIQTYIYAYIQWNPLKHETQGSDGKYSFYQNFMLSEQLGILGALKSGGGGGGGGYLQLLC